MLGGAQIYEQGVPLAKRVVVTAIDADFDGDAYAPTLDAQWKETARESHTSETGWAFSFVTYTRLDK